MNALPTSKSSPSSPKYRFPFQGPRTSSRLVAIADYHPPSTTPNFHECSPRGQYDRLRQRLRDVKSWIDHSRKGLRKRLTTRNGMPSPKSPLDKPSSSHSRRPSSSRRASSDKPSPKPAKNALKSSPSSQVKAHETAPESPSSARVSARPEVASEEDRDIAEPEMSASPRSPQSRTVELEDAEEEEEDRSQEPERGVAVRPNHGNDNEPERDSSKEVQRLRDAMNSQLQLSQQREKLARDLAERQDRGITKPSLASGKSRVSPIHEETTPPSGEEAFKISLIPGFNTASTESTKTIRGAFTPGPRSVRTPSYPFPPMRTPGPPSAGSHRPFTALSPTVNPANYSGGLFDGMAHDQVMSGSVTPASTLRFQPRGSTSGQEDPNFETPDLYELSLMLASEPGLDPWWSTVVQLMRTFYQAHRATLSVPADTTDIENVPWGQKATFNVVEEDELSLTYLQRGSSLVPSSVGTNETSNSDDAPFVDDSQPTPSSAFVSLRPGILSRHSFTAYEDTKRDPVSASETARFPVTRPQQLARAKSYLSARPDMPPRTATLQNAQLSLQSLQDHMAFEDARPDALWDHPDAASRRVSGQVFSILQALDYEGEPLIDNTGVTRVLERGKVVALTRDYPYLENTSDEKPGGSKSSNKATTKPKESGSEKAKRTKPDFGARISSFFGNRSRRSSRSFHSQISDKGKSMPTARASYQNDDERPQTPKYEEYEQPPPSPWSQSPAPSPAVRAETAENPFFSQSSIDPETFNPNTTPQDYTEIPPPETIGVDRSWTVLHIPLIHPLLSKPVGAFRLDSAAMQSKTFDRAKDPDELQKQAEEMKAKVKEASRAKPKPIAILSILSPVIPYPSSLRNSLNHLAPHLATSFSLCRHYSNLEAEIAGLSRKRPQATGFGAVAPGGYPLADRMDLHNISYSPADENVPNNSTQDSMTSPSDYSGVSRSTAGSPAGTPGWDPGSVGLSMDKRSSGGSPGYNAGESYFSSKARPGLGRVDTGSASSITANRYTSSQHSPSETRTGRSVRGNEERLVDPEALTFEESETRRGERHSLDDPRLSSSTSKENRPRYPTGEMPEPRDASPSRQSLEAASLSPRRIAMRTASNQGFGKPHTQLHSYGADFNATFQSLPSTSVPPAKPSTQKTHSRTGSVSVPADYMPPPSDRVKGIMLDSLPMHIFIALPPTGEIVWVNSRYLTYRGQGVKDLHDDPWSSIHAEERDDYLKAWSHAIRSGEQFSMQVRLRRFDGSYRWFYTRAVGLRDSRGVIVQWYGTHMDIHDQHIAEVKAARQEEIEASEAKHKQLANLIPQIIFSATEDEGVTFANQQWLSYTGQNFNDALGLGFMDYIHPDDLAKCHIPFEHPPTPSFPGHKKPHEPSRNPSQISSGGKSSRSSASEAPTESTIKGVYHSLSRTNSSSSSSVYEFPTADLSELARTGVIKVDTDSDGRTSYSTEVRLRSRTGEYRWHLVRCVEVDNINLGSGDGSWFGACADINDHKLLEMKLKEAMESKSKFLSNMSHEIRTPLIGISGMISFLQDSPLNEEQIDYCNTIASSAEGLLNIINDILDLAKADAGMMKLSYNWFHTRSLVEEVNEMVSTIAITKHLEVNYVVDPDVPEMIKGDRFRIRQVLLNVIGNAIKFTTVGEVFSSCRVLVDESSALGENEVMLEFSIIDTGRGFTQEEADLIFKPFSQIDGSSTRTHGGTGLGLVISRQFVELHGGTMEGTAIPGKGSTFTFTAVFGLPTIEDHPEPPATPSSMLPSAMSSVKSSVSHEMSVRPAQVPSNILEASNRLLEYPSDGSTRTGSSGSPTIASSGSSEPSGTARSRITQRSSASSAAHSLAKFSEAARTSPQDPSTMKLTLPDPNSPSRETQEKSTVAPTTTSPIATPAAATILRDTAKLSRESSPSSSDMKHAPPPVFSILIICPQTHSREATTQHIKMTLPNHIPHQITAVGSVAEARDIIGGEDPVHFTHIVINLSSPEEVISLIEQIMLSISLASPTSIVVLSDPVQRQEVMKMATGYDYDQLAKDNRVTFIYKPVKPSRFAVIFDPDKERDLSTDRNRSSARQQVENQRQNYLDIGKRIGNKGYTVLLVEDNATNQKVLLKFLSKIGVAVELAMDGVECTDKVFSHDHSFYSLILCDLHMPNKDGYQACREIRTWETDKSHSRMPIIALSANVMADVLDKCIDAGFSNYITKPVDFKALSTLIGDLLDPLDAQGGSISQKLTLKA